MPYRYYVLFHVIAGTVALLGFWIAAFLRKGSPRHRLVGRAYLLAMVVVGIPPITALVCFRELIGQFSSRPGPRHAADAVGAQKQPPKH